MYNGFIMKVRGYAMVNRMMKMRFVIITLVCSVLVLLKGPDLCLAVESPSVLAPQCRYVIQIASGFDEVLIEKEVADLSRRWKDVRYGKGKTEGRDIYRITVGCFSGVSKANTYLIDSGIRENIPGSFVGNGNVLKHQENTERNAIDKPVAAEVQSAGSVSKLARIVAFSETTEEEPALAKHLDEKTTVTKASYDQALPVTDNREAVESVAEESLAEGMILQNLADKPLSRSDREKGRARENPKIGDALVTVDTRDPTLEDVYPLGITEFIKLVYERNQKIIVDRLEWEISRELVNRSKAIFEPKLIGSYQREYNDKMNTTEEILSRGYKEDFEEENNYTSAAVEGLLPTGGELRFSYLFEDLNSSVSTTQDEFQAFLGMNLTHPLLKNAGVDATMVGIRMAQADSEIAFQTYRQNIMLVIARSAAAYWDLHSSQEKYHARKRSVEIAEEILRDNEDRVRVGKMAVTELIEASAGVALRRSLVSEAKQTLVSAIYNARSYFASSGSGGRSQIVTTDPLTIEEEMPDFGYSFWQTVSLRPEYLSAKTKIERENIRLNFAKNQRLPQLDLRASYVLNGLGDYALGSWNSALKTDHESYSVSFEMQIPLVGGRESKSELRAAKHRKAQALHEFKAVEVALMNAVETAIQDVYNTRDQVRYYDEVRHLNERLLDVELARLDAGKSNSRIVLEKEENLNHAIDAQLDSLIRHRRAVLGLGMAEGSLLKEFGIDTMENL